MPSGSLTMKQLQGRSGLADPKFQELRSTVRNYLQGLPNDSILLRGNQLDKSKKRDPVGYISALTKYLQSSGLDQQYWGSNLNGESSTSEDKMRILKFFRMLLIKMAALERMRRQDKTTARKATTRPAKKAGKEQEEDGTQENENQQDNKLPLQSTPINAAESYSKFPASPLSTTDDAKLKNPTILENERQARIKKLQARATQDRIIAVEGLRKRFPTYLAGWRSPTIITSSSLRTANLPETKDHISKTSAGKGKGLKGKQTESQAGEGAAMKDTSKEVIENQGEGGIHEGEDLAQPCTPVNAPGSSSKFPIAIINPNYPRRHNTNLENRIFEVRLGDEPHMKFLIAPLTISFEDFFERFCGYWEKDPYEIDMKDVRVKVTIGNTRDYLLGYDSQVSANWLDMMKIVEKLPKSKIEVYVGFGEFANWRL